MSTSFFVRVGQMVQTQELMQLRKQVPLLRQQLLSAASASSELVLARQRIERLEVHSNFTV
jgi:hypothetical protein